MCLEADARIDYAWGTDRVRGLRQFGIVILLLASYLTPAMACMVPNAHMNVEEQVCCKAMKHQCEQMRMPASHDCCQKAPQSSQDTLITQTINYHPVAISVAWLSVGEGLNLNPIMMGWVEHTDYSPPQSPYHSISVLRI